MIQKPKIGAHISTAVNFNDSVKRAKAVGAECMQIFVGSPRRYEVKNIDNKTADEFQRLIQLEEIGPVFIHASYLINLSSEDHIIRKKSVTSLVESLKVAEKIGSKGVIYHPGSPKGGNKEKAIEREITSLKEVLEKTPKNTIIFIENTAGIKKIGSNEEEVGYILKELKVENAKVCIDTAHALEAGNIKDFSKESIGDWILRWSKEVSLNNISVLHINDSLTAFNSHRDRHANIGEGFIKEEGFVNLMSFKETRDMPWILEVPGFDNSGPDKKNIDILKKIRNSL